MKNCPAKLKRTIERFMSNQIAVMKLSEFDIRETYISVFVKALGWNWDNEGLSPTALEVYRESTVGSGRPDLKFCLNALSKFYMETKKVKPDFTVQEINQAWVYGYSSGHSFSILCNFLNLWIIDCRNTPFENTADPRIANQVVAKITLTNCLNNWGSIEALLGKNAVKKGSFENLEDSIRKKSSKILGVDLTLFPTISGVKPIDQFFLSQLENWRIRLAKNMHQCKHDLDTNSITLLADRMLNFIVFTRILESRDLAPKNVSLKGALKNALKNPGTLMQEINSIRDTFDSLFNGTVYKAFPFEMELDETVLSDIIRNTYPPHSPYNLAYVPIEMIGTIYEQSLGHQLSFNNGEIIITEKRDVQKAGGIYYTETYISSFMVRQLLDRRINKLSPEEILNLRIADIACGSGSFLIIILRFLILWIIEISQRKDEWREKYLERNENGFKLTLDFKLKLLKNCIYGVDIDPEAVNITKFSLYLEALNEETPSRIHRFYNKKKKPILPILDRNIKQGNSLVSIDIVYEKLFQKDYMKLINPFDFDTEFPEIFENKGFDLIFGNPPYGAKIDGIVKQYCRRYPLAKKNFNTANLFIDRVRSLVNKNGSWCFIVPKSLTYSDRWLGTRNRLRNEFVLGVDASKAFKNVKLEQIIIACDAKRRDFKTGYLSKTDQNLFGGVRELSFSDILPVNIFKEEVEIGEIIAENSVSASDYFRLERGTVPTKLLRPTGTVSVYRGKNVQGYTLLDSKDKISVKQAELVLEKHEYLIRPKIMAQQIIAHIMHPFPHLKFIGAYDSEGKLSVDTVSNIYASNADIGEFPIKLFLGILNSNICSWFADRFIYCKAIRTMHFDNYQLSALRFPSKKHWKEETAKEIIKKVDERIDIEIPKSEIEIKNITKYAKILEAQINNLVGHLFGLSEKQIKMINSAMGTKSLIEMGRLGKIWKTNQKRVPSKKKHVKIESKQRKLF